jgi:hypothetical protein
MVLSILKDWDYYLALFVKHYLKLTQLHSYMNTPIVYAYVWLLKLENVIIFLAFTFFRKKCLFALISEGASLSRQQINAENIVNQIPFMYISCQICMIMYYFCAISNVISYELF